jgi:hypothetical protein
MQLQELQARMTQRLDEAASGPTYYPASELTAALNEGQRFFCLLTLALEATKAWTVPSYSVNGNSAFYHMLGQSGFADWIVPLRISTTTGAKVRPARVAEIAATDAKWWARPGSPSRYVSLGADLVGLYGQPATSITLNVTYARAPVAMANATDAPEIPEPYHPALIDYGINRVRQSEGAQEFQKTLAGLDLFFAAADRYAEYVRARNKGSGYDKLPFELASYDRSQLLNLSNQSR